MSSLQPPRKVELPPWRETPKDDFGRELDPCSLFIGNVPFAMPQSEMMDWLRYCDADYGIVKLKMLNTFLGKPSACIATYGSALQAETALPRVHGQWTSCRPDGSIRFEARTRFRS